MDSFLSFSGFDNRERMNFLELQKARVLTSVSGKAAKSNNVKKILYVAKQRPAKDRGLIQSEGGIRSCFGLRGGEYKISFHL